jgi:hypothetical protein
MSEVAFAPTVVGHSSSSKKIVSMHNSEEAIQLLKQTVFNRSDTMHISAIRNNFHCSAHYTLQKGWVVDKMETDTPGTGAPPSAKQSSDKSSKQQPVTPL